MKVAFGRFTFDADTREVLDGGTRVRLSPKAFDLLRLLLERRPAVVSKRDLHQQLWPDTFVSDANLSVVVAEVRQALGDDAKQGQFIRTVHSVGYSFSGPAQQLAAPRHGAPAPASAGWLCWLVRHDRSFTLSAGENVIGRDPRCGVWLDASGVSRRHARIDVGVGVATIEDLGSSNGTFVAGARLTEPRRLADGDLIEVGAVSMTFRAWTDDTATQTERVTRR